MLGPLELGKLSWNHAKLSLNAVVSKLLQETLEIKPTGSSMPVWAQPWRRYRSQPVSSANGHLMMCTGCSFVKFRCVETWACCATHVALKLML